MKTHPKLKKHVIVSLAFLLGLSAFSQVPIPNVTGLSKVDTRTLRTGSLIQLSGYYTNGDAGGGDLRYDANATNTVDNGIYFATPTGTGRFVRVLNGQPVTPRMYGARADGVTADDTQFNAAKNYAASIGAFWRVTPGQYMISNAIIANTNLHLIMDPGAEIVRPAAATDYTFRVQPASTPTFTQNLSTDVREGNISIYVVSTNGYRAGDWIVIGDRSTRDPGNTASDAPNQEIAQILRIETNRIDLVSHVRNDYRTSNTNQMARLNELDVKIYGGKFTITTNGTTAGGIFMNYVTGGNIHDVHIEGHYLPGIHFQRSTRVKVSDSTIRRGTGVEFGGIGYAYYASRSSDLIQFDNCFQEGVRESQVDSGASDITWVGCRSAGTYDDGFNVHGQGCKRIKFLSCDVSESRGYGILVSFNGAHYADSFVDILYCKVRANLSALYFDYSVGTNSHVRAIGNELQGQRYAIEVGRSGYGLEIGDNKCTAYGQSLTGSGMLLTNCVGANIYNNSFYGYISAGIYLAPGSSNNVIRNTTLRDMLNNTAMEIAGNDNIIDGVIFQDSSGSSIKDTGANNKWTRFDAKNLPSGIGLWFDGATSPSLDGFTFVNVANAILLTNLNRALIRNGSLVAATNSTNPFKDYANNTRYELIKLDGTLATNANDTAFYNVSGTNKTYLGISFTPGGLFDNGIYSESGVSGVTVRNSLFEDGITARMIGGSGVLTRHYVQNCTFRNTGAYPLRPNGMSDCAFIDNVFENTPVWALSAVNGGTNVLITGNRFRSYNTTNATLFPNNNTTVIETDNYYGTGLESFLTLAESTNGWPTSIPTNSVYIRTVRKSGGVEVWGMRSDGVTLSSNLIYPIASSTVKVDGVNVSSPDFGDTPYIDIDSSGSSVTAELAIGAVISNLFVAGANMTLDKSSGTSIVFSASGGGGATNGTGVSLNAGSLYSLLNLQSSAEIVGTASGPSNVYWSLVASSVSTSKIDNTFWNWIDGKTSITNLNDLSDVNIGTPSTGQLLMYTNSIWTNLTVSLGGGTTYTGTNGVTISGSVISGFYYPSNNIAFTTNANGSIHIAAIVSTNSGTTVTVDGGSTLTTANFADGGGIGFTYSGGNVTADVEANAVALATDTTGNYVATVTGTANQITVSGSGSENAAVTLSLPSTVNIDTLNVGTLGLTNPYTAVYINGQLITPARFTNNETAEQGRVLWLTNAAGEIRAYATNLPSGGGGGGTNILFVSGSPITNANLVSSANATVSISSGTNVTYTFTGVGSNTNGYYDRSASYVSISNTTAETTVYSWTIPANTLTANGDELLFFIPGKYLEYTGQTTGYDWHFYIDHGEVSPSSVNGSYPNSFASVSSSFATVWRAHVRRLSSTTASLFVEHATGADNSSDSTNLVSTIRYLAPDHTLAASWASDVTFALTFTPSVANTSHGLVAFGYDVTKVGSVGGGGGGGSGGDVYTSSNNVFTGANTFPSINLNGQTETNWPTMGVRRNQTKVDGVPYWNFIKVEDWLNASSGTAVESGMQMAANGGSIVANDVAFGAPGIRRLRVDSTNDAPVASWASVSIATNTGPECWFTESRVRVRTLSVGTSEIQARIGFFNGLSQTNIPNHSAICIYDTNRVGTAWGFLTSTNGTLGTITASSTTVTADSWVRLGVALFTDKAIGYINGVPFATNTTSLPTGQVIGPGFGLAQVAGTGTANMDLQIDWTEFRYYSGQ